MKKSSYRCSKAHATRIDKMWVAYDLAVDAALQMALNILADPDEEEAEYSVAKQIVDIARVFDRFIAERSYLINTGWRLSAQERTNNLLDAIWGVDEDGKLHPSFYTLATGFALLCEDLMECFPKSGHASEVWGSLKTLLEQISSFSEWAKDENPDPVDFHDKLRAILLEGVEPPKQEQPRSVNSKPEKLSLYEIFGDTIVLAKNRAEAKAVLQRVKGWIATGKDICGINPGEKFGDGRTCHDVIEQYRNAAPCVVGESA